LNSPQRIELKAISKYKNHTYKIFWLIIASRNFFDPGKVSMRYAVVSIENIKTAIFVY
jgi:hypothetical protein